MGGANPQTRDEERTSVDEITDRRNELSGNISLNQELRFIVTVNGWIDEGDLSTAQYSHTEVRRLVLDERLGYASKLDRNSEFIERLREEGIDDAEGFLATLDFDGHQHDGFSDASHH